MTTNALTPTLIVVLSFVYLVSAMLGGNRMSKIAGVFFALGALILAVPIWVTKSFDPVFLLPALALMLVSTAIELAELLRIRRGKKAQ